MLLVTLVTLAYFPFSNASACQAGRYYPSAGVATYSCILCPAGKFGNVSGLDSESAACASLCPAGKYGTLSGSTSAVSACGKTCPAGKYGNIPGKAREAEACPNQCSNIEAIIPSHKLIGPPTKKLDACCPLTWTFKSDECSDTCKHSDRALCTQLGLALFEKSHPNIADKCGKDCNEVKRLKQLVSDLVLFNVIDFIVILVSFFFVLQIELVEKRFIVLFVVLFLIDIGFQLLFIIISSDASTILGRLLVAHCTYGGSDLRDQILIAQQNLAGCVTLGCIELFLGFFEIFD